MKNDPHAHARNYTALVRALATSKTIWAIIALIAVLAVVSGCALDTARLEERRAQVREACQGALTPHLRALCEHYGVDTDPSPTVR